MGSYIPSTLSERQAMVDEIGLSSVEDLFQVIPEQVRVHQLRLPGGCSELEVRRLIEAMAGENILFRSIFRGAGAYHHYIPSIVKTVVSKEEFVTAYTPYQAEISQGILQSIFEYQTMICELTGLDVSNASVYDGAGAAAEAVTMCVERKRPRALVSASTNPQVIETIRTYCEGSGTQVMIVPTREGVTDQQVLADLADDETACLYVQQPNFWGLVEDTEKLGEIVHASGGKFIMGCNPIALSMYKTPAQCGADVAVGEGQPLGMPLSFGGPYLGFITCTSAMVRRMPGRVVGQTQDADGNRAFVLTLQAREQHIRREKASSNICSNQALCALTASVYMAALGGDGLKEVAVQCTSKAHYAAQRLCELPGVKLVFSGEYFHEFVTTWPADTNELMEHLQRKGILGGLPVKEGILWCVTETCTKAQIDALVSAVREVLI